MWKTQLMHAKLQANTHNRIAVNIIFTIFSTIYNLQGCKLKVNKIYFSSFLQLQILHFDL